MKNTKKSWQRWSQEEFDLAYQLKAEGKDNAQIARQLGRTVYSIHAALMRYEPSKSIPTPPIAQAVTVAPKATTKAFSLSVPLKLSSISIKDGILTIEMEAEG